MILEAGTQCIFEQSWWLEAVAPGCWHDILIGTELQPQARWRFAIEQRKGMRCLVQPVLTPSCGPWLQLVEGKMATRLAHEKDLLGELVSKLPKHDYIALHLHPSRQNWLPFYWAGFAQTTRYTYVLSGLQDHEALWRGFAKNIKSDINKAEKKLRVEKVADPARFYALNRLTFQRQGMGAPYDLALVERLHAAAAAHDAMTFFFAVDEQGRDHAGLCLVHDHRTAYYLMGGADPELRNSGASSLLMWSAIREAGARGLEVFDFEGSMIEPIERFFRGFGAEQQPYHRITRAGRRMRLMLAARELLNAGLGR
ncbi:MAG: family N-acetyltransferase [Moraxellaceae bacterium]|jgi:hypothetical protein|nr:family N-acetyltransferase [Moraxellaceae bacterium]